MSLLDLIAEAHTKVLRPSGGCHNCPRRRVDFVPATLAAGSVLWLGEAPGATEVEMQEGFVGKSGELLRTVAKAAGVPEPWSFSNTIHCRPPKNATPKPKEVSCCLSQFVLTEIQDYQFVVMCGNVPLQALFPGARADHFRGNVAWHPDFPGQRFYAIYHPAYMLRRPDLKPEFERQLQRLGRIARGEDTSPTWTLVRGSGAVAALRKMMESPLLSFDLETNRLESWVEGGRIRSLAATTDGKTVVVAHEDEAQFRAMLEMVGEYISRPEKSVVGSHVAFDLEWVERECGVRAACQLVHETAIAWYQARQYKMPSLKELVSRELDGYRYLIHHPNETRDVDLLLTYNAEDVVHPLHLLKRSTALLKPKTRDLVTRVLGPAALIFQRMHTTGFYLRQDYRQAKIEEYAERRRGVVEAWKAEDPEFIPDEHESGHGLRRYLFDVRKLPTIGETETGDPSTDKAAIKQWIRDGHTVLRHLLELKEIDKIQSTYLKAYDKHLWGDSRVRSRYLLTWTDSGRTSSREPNLQNIPRLKEIRDLFGVPPGRLLIESDLSQIEFRIMVCLAKDQTGIAGYLRGDDAHTMTARRATGNPTPTKKERTQAKPVNFGCLYGGSEFMLQRYAADEYGVIWTIEEARHFRDMFMSTYEGIPIFHASRKALLQTNRGWFESVVGHNFFYSDWDNPDQGRRDHAFRSALNAEAQGPAAQLCYYIMVLARRLLDKRGMQDVEFVNHVHDSILSEVPDPAMAGDVIATINEAAVQAHAWVKDWFVVPLIMEHEVGESWGSLRAAG